jgi:5'-AMP-activated protein kinase catalytic alpha subunit
MVVGFLPFEDSDTAELYQKVLSGEFEIPDWLSQSVIDLIKGLLKVNPEERWNLATIIEHPWV